jgi:hypothetical protein
MAVAGQCLDVRDATHNQFCQIYEMGSGF